MSRVLLTDLGNVVIFFDRRRAAAGFRPFAPEKTIDEIDELINKSPAGMALLEQFETGAIPGAKYRSEIGRMLGTKTSADDFWTAHTNLFTPNLPVINLWEKLRSSGAVAKIIAVSDTDPMRLKAGLAMLASCGLTPDATVASCDIGRRKPDPSMYRAALERAECPPDQCLFIDDNPSYVRAAEEYGITGICYESGDPRAQEMLLKSLRNAGLSV